MVVKFTDFRKKRSPSSGTMKTNHLFLLGAAGEKSDLLLYTAVQWPS